jgi:hypothetical protein
MLDVFILLWSLLIGLFRSRARLEAEILVLRQQINVLRRNSPKRYVFGTFDRCLFVGLYPGVLLVPLAVIVAVTQRSKLARSMDVTDRDRLRRKRLKASAVLAASLPVIYLVSLPILGDDWGTDAVVAFGVWFAVLIAAACYFVAGISTPKAPAATH